MAAWLQARPGETHVVDAIAWLEGGTYAAQIMNALRKVLMSLWQTAWEDGTRAAGAALSAQVAADRIARFALKWLHEVTRTRMLRIAEILAGGGTAAELEAAIAALLGNEADAKRIALTEIYRAMNAAAAEAYRANGVKKVRWVTRSANPCPVCLENEAAGPHYLGEPFPSGDTAPPAHPNCECALMPAEDG